MKYFEITQFIQELEAQGYIIEVVQHRIRNEYEVILQYGDCFVADIVPYGQVIYDPFISLKTVEILKKMKKSLDLLCDYPESD